MKQIISNDIIITETDAKLLTATADLKNVTNNNIQIPLCINMDGSHTIGEFKNIEDRKIKISKFLRNKYKGNNIKYIDSKVPLNISRAFYLSDFKYKTIIDLYNGDFSTCCKDLYKIAMNKDLEFLKEYLQLDKELMNECHEYIETMKNYNKGFVENYTADIDLIKNIVIPNKEKLILLLNQNYINFKMEVFNLYQENEFISKNFWNLNLEELPIAVKMHLRINYEKI